MNEENKTELLCRTLAVQVGNVAEQYLFYDVQKYFERREQWQCCNRISQSIMFKIMFESILNKLNKVELAMLQKDISANLSSVKCQSASQELSEPYSMLDGLI